jgi:hypothetical protein
VGRVKQVGFGPELKCRGMFAGKFNFQSILYVDFIHKNRNFNVDVHTLARSLISFDTGRHVWVLNPPSGIRNSYDQLHE